MILQNILGGILGSIQFLVNFLFFLTVMGTAGFSWWLSKKYEERFAEFPWKKAGLILGIEVLSWIGFTIFWAWVEQNLWVAVIVIGVVIAIVIKRKKDKYAV